MKTSTKRLAGLGAALAVTTAGVAAPAAATPAAAAAVARATDAGQVRPTPITAQFNVTVGDTVVGQEVYVVGSIPELGSWDPAKAVRLSTTSATFPWWTGTVALPANEYVEFQYIVKNADGTVARWESGYGRNRSTKTPPTGDYITHDSFTGF